MRNLKKAILQFRLLLLLILFLLLDLQQLYSFKHLVYCRKDLNKSENDSIWHKQIYNFAKLSKKDSWCGAYVMYILNKSNAKYPFKRSPNAQSWYWKNSNKISAKDIILYKKNIDSSYLIVWRRGETVFGHIGFVENYYNSNKIQTIEGNVSNKVLRKYRKIELYNYFRILGFVKIEY